MTKKSHHRNVPYAFSLQQGKDRFWRIRGAAGRLCWQLSAHVLLPTAMRGVRGQNMENPAKGPTRSQPEPGCDHQPKDTSQEITIIDLPTARDKETDNCCRSCLGQWRLPPRKIPAASLCLAIVRKTLVGRWIVNSLLLVKGKEVFAVPLVISRQRVLKLFRRESVTLDDFVAARPGNRSCRPCCVCSHPHE